MIKKRKRNRESEEEIIAARKELAQKEQVAAIWTRVSSADQYRSNCSIPTQIAGCEEYCKSRGIRIKKYFGGENESAKEAGDLFLDMIGEVLADPEYNTIVVFDFDRFSRCSNDGIVYKTKVKRSGVQVLSVNQPIDQNNVLAEQIENILIIIADIDNAMRRHKCHQGMVDCVKRGEWYSKAPFGYDSKKVDKTHVLSVNEKGKILKMAFEWIANEPEISQAEVLRRLKARGVDIPKQRLSYYLRNRFYCGELEHKYLGVDKDGNKIVIQGKQEKLISKELFERVQDILSGNNSNYEQAVVTPEFPLKKHVFCSKDNHVLTGYTTKGHKYYKCPESGCKTNIRAEELHQKYADILNALNIKEELRPLIIAVAERKFEEKEDSNIENRTVVLKNISTLQTKMDNVVRRFADGDIDRPVYDMRKAELEKELAAAREELAQYDESVSNLTKYTDEVLATCSMLGTYWLERDFNICQKIQKLVFPTGAYWDNEKRGFRTQNMNTCLNELFSISMSYEDVGARKKDTSEEMSYLVAEAGLEPATSGL